jgi:hypothetical protein
MGEPTEERARLPTFTALDHVCSNGRSGQVCVDQDQERFRLPCQLGLVQAGSTLSSPEFCAAFDRSITTDRSLQRIESHSEGVFVVAMTLLLAVEPAVGDVSQISMPIGPLGMKETLRPAR